MPPTGSCARRRPAVHPFSPEEGRLNDGPRYERTEAEYGRIAQRQLVSALQVHVAVGGAERTLARLQRTPRAPPGAGRARRQRPLPRRGRTPGSPRSARRSRRDCPARASPRRSRAGRSWPSELRWGAAAGALPEMGLWWWELRPAPHARDPRAAGAGRPDHGRARRPRWRPWPTRSSCGWQSVTTRDDLEHAAPTWRIAENRWSACRHGVEGALADLASGERTPTRAVLTALVDRLEPVAERIGAAGELERARALIERNGAIRQREVAAAAGRARAGAVARGPLRPRPLIYGANGRVTARGWPSCPNRADP